MMMLHVMTVMIVIMSIAACTASLEPPVAKRVEWQRNIHNTTSTDYYYWLRNLDTDPDVIKYIDSENNYTSSIMSHTWSLQETLANEMLSRYVGGDTRNISFWEQGSYLYYIRYEAASMYDIYCRIPRHDRNGVEEVLLNVNELVAANNTEFLTIGVFEISPDENLLAFSVDYLGNERFQLYIKDLTLGTIIPTLNITDTYYHLRWCQSAVHEASYVFFTSQDELGLPRYVYRYEVPSLDPLDLQLVYNATTDDGYYTVTVIATNDNEYTLINIYTDTDNSVMVLPSSTPLSSFQLLYPHERDVRYDVEHYNGTFIIRTNSDGYGTHGVTHPNFHIILVDADTPSYEGWTDIVKEPAGNHWIDLVESFQNYIAIWMWQDGLRHVYIKVRDHSQSHGYNTSLILVPMDDAYVNEDVYSMMPGTSSNLDDRRYRTYDTNDFVYSLRSLSRLITVYSYTISGIDSNHWQLRTLASDTSYEQYGYDPSLYKQERIWSLASDGAKIPTSIIYRRDLFKHGRDGGNPMFMIGYGAYGGVEETQFDVDIVSLLDRGVIYGWAHIRGDGDMGMSWWQQGRVLQKRNTFTDFISVAEHFIRLGYTSSDRLAVRGRSAGGILAGSLLILKPSLFKVVIAMVPFLDTITTEIDITIPWAQWEWLEWGSPYIRSVYDYMMSYSPYDNIGNVSLSSFPNVMVTSGLYDPRVKYYEPTKFVAKLRHHIRTSFADSNGNATTIPRVVLVTENAGHFGPSSLDGYVAAQAYLFAFILDSVQPSNHEPNGWLWYYYFIMIVAIVIGITLMLVMYRRYLNNKSNLVYTTLATNARLAAQQVTTDNNTTNDIPNNTNTRNGHKIGNGSIDSSILSSVVTSPSARLAPATSSTYSSTSIASTSTSTHTRTTSGTMLV